MTGRAGKMQHFRYGVAKMRGRWYYRYHKPIGKANWKGYQERYLRPKDVEAKQRLVFAARPTTKQFKQSISWEWRLPKLLAQATTPNQVLDAWILFRYRQPKKVYHYMLTLRRLVDVGGCEPTDWRLQVLLCRMRKVYKRVINHDLLIKYFSKLGLYKEMEKLTRFMKPRLPMMTPAQLVTVLDSFREAQLRDTAVAGLCARYLRRNLKLMSTSDITRSILSLAQVEVRNSGYVSNALAEVLSRSLSLKELISSMEAARLARVRDYSLIELTTLSCRASLQSGSVSDLNDACLAVEQIALMGTPDRSLFTEVVKNIDPYRLSVPALTGLVIATAGRVEITALLPAFEVVRRNIPLLASRRTLVDVAGALDMVFDDINDATVFLVELFNRLAALRTSTESYNTARAADIAMRRELWNESTWKSLISDARFSLEDFEPKDFIATAITFGALPADILPEKRIQLANEVAEWSIKRWEEFTPAEWSTLTSALTKDTFKCSQAFSDMLMTRGSQVPSTQPSSSSSA